ncbi:pe38-like protein [Glossina pallidipes salivary gland hypertrophy virus]|uniref:Pe38-like protein n=1 Tax=Glossina hytrovirus (isolate Glossina pallidipes/Ethiopia/Seibersdorf/-) TaxID=379529 RepID=B0YLT0_GHVS|nr:pe38-like protein [Glossina pallidipes salivary gland hypertrophy virus]ABQ08899.1 pe38-like protein [Glossina pallidipes salivary gland hypertrophy virus]
MRSVIVFVIGKNNNYKEVSVSITKMSVKVFPINKVHRELLFSNNELKKQNSELKQEDDINKDNIRKLELEKIQLIYKNEELEKENHHLREENCMLKRKNEET